MAIMTRMAANEGWDLPSDVALFLASHVHSNIRELEGSLRNLMTRAAVKERRPDIELAKEVVRTLSPHEEPKVSMDLILRMVAREFGLRTLDLRSRTNERRISFPRQIAMYLSKKLAGQSYPAIATFVGHKNHTTALHACRKIEALRRTDPSMDALIRRIEDKLRGADPGRAHLSEHC
ncbi:MAG: hypothetical protein HC882_00770 [Acidobacteria bacterium]|nr:hypothetical protein [Acidobacteriota bacterium]